MSSREYERFLNIAEGSLAELQYLLLLPRDLGFASQESVSTLIARAETVARLLHRLRTGVAAA